MVAGRDGEGVHPVHGVDAAGTDVPALEVGFDAGGTNDERFAFLKVLQGFAVEVVVVVVREQDGVEGWQVVDCEWWREEAFGARPLDQGGALREDGVDEEVGAVDFNEERGMAEQGDAKAGWGWRLEDGSVCMKGAEGAFGDALFVVGEELAEHFGKGTQGGDGGGYGIGPGAVGADRGFQQGHRNLTVVDARGGVAVLLPLAGACNRVG